MGDNPLRDKLLDELAALGMHPKMLSHEYSPGTFGNAVVRFRYGNLLLQFVRDRAIDELNIAHVDRPREWFWSTDIEIAMGWKSAQDVVSAGAMAPTKEAIGVVKAHAEEIEDALLHKHDVLVEGRWRRCAAQWGPDISAFPPEDQERMKPYLKPQ